MKKIMFNDRFGLTDAVLAGHKTMTRRVVSDKQLIDAMAYGRGCTMKVNEYLLAHPTYKVGEEVAVAQSYHALNKSGYVAPEGLDHVCEDSAGYENKMFVRSDLMPHGIKITGVKLERLQDISDEDCLKEGIVPFVWRQYLKQEIDDVSPQKYKDHNVYTLPKFVEGLRDAWADSDPDEYIAESPFVAFMALIRKMEGKKVWDRNPRVFVYSFELVR